MPIINVTYNIIFVFRFLLLALLIYVNGNYSYIVVKKNKYIILTCFPPFSPTRWKNGNKYRNKNSNHYYQFECKEEVTKSILNIIFVDEATFSHFLIIYLLHFSLFWIFFLFNDVDKPESRINISLHVCIRFIVV